MEEKQKIVNQNVTEKQKNDINLDVDDTLKNGENLDVNKREGVENIINKFKQNVLNLFNE